MLQIKKILYPTDFSSCSREALTHAIVFAEHYNAELHMLHVTTVDENFPYQKGLSFEGHFENPMELTNRARQIAESELSTLVNDNQEKPLQIIEVVKQDEHAALAIIDYAQQNDIDLITMGTHGWRGTARFFLGSVTEEVTRRSPCPLFTLREARSRHIEETEPEPIHKMGKILVPIDFSEHSHFALSHAKELAALYGGTIQLVHVVERFFLPEFYDKIVSYIQPGSQNELLKASAEILHDTMKRIPGPEVPYEVHALSGRVVPSLMEFAEENQSDMIVVATHGLTSLENTIFGSTAEQLIRKAPCPVFTVKSFGRKIFKDQ